MVAGPKLNALTGLRFFAAFAIVIHHSRGTFLPVDAMSLWPLDSAVSFFFVLSGFILTHVYPELPTCKHITKFFLARVARLWPVHVVTLVLALLLFPEIMLRSGWWALGANIAALHAWIPRGDFFFSFNAVSWSISCELGFYLLFPLLINDLRSTWAWKLIPSLLAAMVLIAICTVLDLPPFGAGHTGLTSTGFLYTNPLARLFEFMLGMSAAVFWKNYRKTIGRTNAIAWTLIEFISIAVLILYIVYGRIPAFGVLAHLAPGNLMNWLVHTDTAAAFALVIVATASGTGWISRILGSAPLVFLGEISYSIYMLHQIMIEFLSRHGLISWVPYKLQFFVLLALIIALSAVCYLLVESPMRGTIVQLVSRRAQPSTPASGLTAAAHA